MKKVLLFTLLISFIGYSQSPIQPNHPSLNDGLLQSLESQNNQIITENNDQNLKLYHVRGTVFRYESIKGKSYYRLSEYFSNSEKIYDNNGNIILKTTDRMDIESNSSIPINKNEYTYNENGNLIQMLWFYWDIESQSYILGNKQEYTYNENGNVIEMIVYYWDIESQSYSLSNKQEYNYNENGNLIQMIKSTWGSESQFFSYYEKEEYTYNVNGDRILQLGFLWNVETESFDVPYNQIDMVYDESQRLISRTLQRQWDSNNQLWDYRLVRDSVWDENKNTLVSVKFWDSESNTYIPSHKSIKTFSNFSQNFLESSTTHSWNEELNIYEPTFKTTFSTTLDSDDELHRTGSISKYNIDSGDWDEIDSRFFKYTKIPSLSTNSVEPNSFSIYPNPTSNKLLINSSESLSNPLFELYDVKGSKILSNPFKLTEPIDVSDLQPSMYIYNVKDGSELKQSGKVLIE